jgi:hypothetical protein
MQINSTSGKLQFVCAYAPTLSAADATKDNFYDSLSAAVQNIPANNPLYILGDFNARVGSDHHAWPTCLVKFGIGKLNDNGQCLLEFLYLNGLSVTNTFFDTKPQHKVSWRHPRSKHWHQLDLVLILRRHLNSVKMTRSYHGAD